MIKVLVAIEGYFVGTHDYPVVWTPLYVAQTCYKYIYNNSGQGYILEVLKGCDYGLILCFSLKFF